MPDTAPKSTLTAVAEYVERNCLPRWTTAAVVGSGLAGSLYLYSKFRPVALLNMGSVATDYVLKGGAAFAAVDLAWHALMPAELKVGTFRGRLAYYGITGAVGSGIYGFGSVVKFGLNKFFLVQTHPLICGGLGIAVGFALAGIFIPIGLGLERGLGENIEQRQARRARRRQDRYEHARDMALTVILIQAKVPVEVAKLIDEYRPPNRLRIPATQRIKLAEAKDPSLAPKRRRRKRRRFCLR